MSGSNNSDDDSNQSENNDLAVPEVSFALSPGPAHAALLDFSTKEHNKIFKNVTEPLNPKFDLKTKNMHVFIGKICNRACLCGCKQILDIPVSKNGTTSDLNLQTHHDGEAELKTLCEDATAKWVHSEDRNTQCSSCSLSLTIL